jgi:hypothetical protein
MADAPKLHEPRRAEVLEALVELYLRLNGYFAIRNYLQHRTEQFGLETETDLLAIRMPNQHEVLADGRQQPNDPTLILPNDQALVDCVIAEVKEPSVEFNRPIRGPDGPRLITGALRMFDVLPLESFGAGGRAERIANDLHSKINNKMWTDFPQTHSAEDKTSVRMLVFAPDSAKHSKDRKYVDLQHVLNFTRDRMRLGEPCAPYRDAKAPSASPWRGCTALIVETLDKCGSLKDGKVDVAAFIETVLSGWANHR